MQNDRHWFLLWRYLSSDKSNFLLSSYINRQHYRIWDSEKPEFVVGNPQKVTIWCYFCALMAFWIFVCPDIEFWKLSRILHKQGHSWCLPRTLDSRHMVSAGWTFSTFKRRRPRFTHKSQWQSCDWKTLPRSFGYGLNLTPPPYRPDLSSLEFFLWTYIKDKIYRVQPKTIEKLKTAIICVVMSFPTD